MSVTMFFFAWSTLLLLLLFASPVVQGKQSNNYYDVTSRLSVNIPHKLFKQDGYQHIQSLFGAPPYGGSIAQYVYYADSDLCGPNVNTTKGYPIRAKDENGNQTPWQAPFILMVDRGGGCTFVKKVRNAQHAGAAGVLIADNTCVCSDSGCINKYDMLTCETQRPIMADDGSGRDISIPSFFMFKVDADLIIDTLKQNQPVQIEMSWGLPKPYDRVNYDLWTTPTDIFSKNFLENFKPIAHALGDRAYFTPHMYIYDGLRTHCFGEGRENICYNLCTDAGMYCATDPNNGLLQGISGADVVKESLRRLCIWKHYGESDGIGLNWWSYIGEFIHRCNIPDYFMSDDCINDCYKHAGVDADIVNQCMIDAGGLQGDVPNALLDLEIKAQSERGVVVLPTAFVDNVAIRDKLSPNTVFRAICAGYAEDMVPKICHKCSSCSDSVSCVKTGVCQKSASPEATVSTHFFATLMLLLIIAAFAPTVYFRYKSFLRKQRSEYETF